jgi:DNA polymerase
VVSARQAAYLQALGVDVYLPRDAVLAPDPPVVAPVASPLAAPSPAPAPVRVEPAGVAPGAGALDWTSLRAAVAACTRCPLHATRSQTVFGVGDVRARWMFIGEAPGLEEDRQGEPFVGRAGQLLNAMIRAVGLRREDVYIANVLKCRPPDNRDPRPVEAASCRSHLDRQIELVDPTLVVAVGRIAAQNLLGTDAAIGKLRGRLHTFGSRPWPLAVVYHPAYLLRSPAEKRRAWQDLLFARQACARLAAAGPTPGGTP